MLSINELKAKLTLNAVANQYALPQLQEGYQDCPFCGRSNKLKVSQQRYYKCYHPGCIAHNGGSVLDYPLHHRRVADLKQSQAALSDLLIRQDGTIGRDRSVQTAVYHHRSSFLQQVFTCYQRALAFEDAVLDQLNQRGYSLSLELVEPGYAPAGNYLQDCGFKLSDLQTYGLAYANGREFYQNRVIFPIRDSKRRLVHFHARALDPEVELRWLATPSKVTWQGQETSVPAVTHYLFHQEHMQTDVPQAELFLTEGISDGLSLLELELPTVSCFGVEVQLTRHVELFKRVERLYVLLDNDRYAQGTELAGLYKSWTPMVKHLADLKRLLPQLQIYCCPPPSKPGLKDVNEWLQAGLTASSLRQYMQKHALNLEEFAIVSLGQRWEYQPLLVSLVGINRRPEDLMLLRQATQRLEPDPIVYAMRLLEQVPRT